MPVGVTVSVRFVYPPRVEVQDAPGVNSSCCAQLFWVNLYSYVPGSSVVLSVYTPSPSPSAICQQSPHQPLNEPLTFTKPTTGPNPAMSTAKVTATGTELGSAHVAQLSQHTFVRSIGASATVTLRFVNPLRVDVHSEPGTSDS